MEYVEGEPIDVLRESDCSSRAARALRQVCAQSVRAPEPGGAPGSEAPNILVTHDGVKLLDFGIAKLLRPGEASDPDTGCGCRRSRRSTPARSSSGASRFPPSTDVYALGVLLFELLAGCWPYRPRDRSISSIERAVLEHDPDRPSVAIMRPPERGGPTELDRAERAAIDDPRRAAAAAPG